MMNVYVDERVAPMRTAALKRELAHRQRGACALRAVLALLLLTLSLAMPATARQLTQAVLAVVATELIRDRASRWMQPTIGT